MAFANGIAASLAAALVALSAAVPVQWIVPSPGTSASDTAQTTTRDWRVPGPSKHAKPAELMSGWQHGQRNQLSYMILRDDRPQIVSESVRSQLAAALRVHALQQRNDVLAIDIDSRMTIDTVSSHADDALRANQWALTRLGAEQVWQRSRGRGVNVAVLDTGVAHHPDLAGSFAPGADFTSLGGDGRNDGHQHGTHVAGIIAATANNGIGVAGLAPDVTITPVKVLDNAGSGTSSDVARGVIWATDQGVDLINLSLGGNRSEVLETAVAYALNQRVVVVAASGNSRLSGSPRHFPGASPGVIGVAATDKPDTIGYFSNAGDYVDVAAPGVSVVSTALSGSYKSLSGTSMATPYASASIALTLARQRELGRNLDAATLLTLTADDRGTPGRDNDFGYGVINPLAATSAIDNPGQPPNAPANVRVSAPRQDRIRVAWDAADPAPARVTVSVSPGNLFCNAEPGVTSCEIADLSPATQYRVRVAALNAAGVSGEIVEVSVSTPHRADRASDTIHSATPLTQTAGEDFIDSPADIDWWLVDVPVAGTLAVSLRNMPANYDLRIADFARKDSSNQGAFAFSGRDGTSDEMINTTVAPGRYAIKVYPVNWRTLDWSLEQQYRLTVSLPSGTSTPAPSPTPTPTPTPTAPTPSPPAPSPSQPPTPTPTPTAPAPVTNEPTPSQDLIPSPAPGGDAGNTLQTATRLGFDSVGQDTIATATDRDFWYLDAPADRGLTWIYLTRLAGPFDLEMYDATGRLVGYSVFGGTHYEFLKRATLRSGRHYLLVYPTAGKHDPARPYQLWATSG